MSDLLAKAYEGTGVVLSARSQAVTFVGSSITALQTTANSAFAIGTGDDGEHH
jgi:hypothetical protein